MGRHQDGEEYSIMYYRKKSWDFFNTIWDMQEGLCLDCKKELSKVNRRTAHMHHVDNNFRNNCIENLVILCAKCHSKRHMKPEKKSRAGHVRDNSKIRSILGVGIREAREKLNKAGRSFSYSYYKWELIKNKPGAIEVAPGIGKIYKIHYKRDYGYTLQEIGDFMGGLSRQRVEQMFKKNNPRVFHAITEMNILYSNH